MVHSKFTQSALAVLALCSVSFGAPPIEKTGVCPELTRYQAPVADNWSQFPIRPPAPFTPNCTRNMNADSASKYCTLQNPLTPAQSINCAQVPPGLKPQIIASELTPGPAPAAAYIMNFTFDEKGRMWAIEPRDYPYVHHLGGASGLASNRTTGGQGRVLIYEDTDRDGSLDSYKVFYKGLVLPTSIEYVPGAQGGVIVNSPPYVYFLKKSTANPDTAGDTSRVLTGYSYTGNSYDTHGQSNSLTAGIDNFYYSHNGYGGCGTVTIAGTSPTVSATCSGSTSSTILRFKATSVGSDTNVIQVYARGNSGTNAHGIGTMEDGQWFASRATVNIHSLHAPRLGVDLTSTLVGDYNSNQSEHVFYPLTRDLYLWEGSSTQSTGGFPSSQVSAVSGHDYYTARLLPEKYWNRFSFQCEGATKLCNQDSMTVNGSTWKANRMAGQVRSNIFASTDAWTAPLKVRTGPDGALWVLDFYNYLFLHNPASPSQNAAWTNALRTKSRVRIYRIIPESGATNPVLDLSNATVPQLVQTLGHSNMTWRLMAQRILLSRSYTVPDRNAIVDSLYRILTTDLRADTAGGIQSLGTNGKVLHALWTAVGMKAYTFDANPARWDSVMQELLLHPAWTVRRNALLALPISSASASAIKNTCAVNDPHPHVRLQALASLIAQPAPAGGPAQIVPAYRTLDTHSQSAFTAAGATKVENLSGTERPTSCPAIKVASGTTSIANGRLERASMARNDLRFDVRNGGFALVANSQLNSGELVVSDLRGKVVFRSTYNKVTGQWSNAAATNLSLPVYFYTYREIAGASFRGRVTLASDL